VNDRMVECFKGMFIDEEKELLNISDHCLVRAWFNVVLKQELIGKSQNING